MNIKPVNTILQAKSNTFSRYAQRYLKPQVKNTSFALERFLGETDSKVISQHEQNLKRIGIKQVGKDVKEGVVISDSEYDYRVFSSDDGYLGLDVFKSGEDEICRHFRVNSQNDKYYHSGDFSGLSIEDEMNRVLEFVGDKIYAAKRECAKEITPQPFIPSETTSKKIAEVNKALQSGTKNTDIKDSGHIGSEEKELLESINEKFRFTQGLYKKITDGRIKWEVRKSYPNYLPQPVTNKLGFKNIGPNGESISFFDTSYRNKGYTAITVTDSGGEELSFVISKENGSVQKNPPSKYVKSDNSDYRILITPDYYTQKEIDESKLSSYLVCLDKAMDGYISHTQNWLDKRTERMLIRSNHDAASLEPYKELLDDIHTNFESYRTKMRKYMRKPHQNKPFKQENGISTQLASTAVKFDNITPEGYDLRLSYPKVNDKTATQLLVMRDDKVENSFYIIDDKLLRFQIKDTNDKIANRNRKFYYYDNKYLQESNLNSYLLLLQEKLHELNQKLDAIRKKQLENKAKYHTKTKEKN